MMTGLTRTRGAFAGALFLSISSVAPLMGEAVAATASSQQYDAAPETYDTYLDASKSHSAEEPATQQRARRTTRRSRPSARSTTARPASASSAWTSPRGASALAADLGNMLTSHTRSGTWGAIVVSLTRGDTLFAYNADAMLQPASTMKMFTSALALEQFGPDHTFSTAVLRDGAVGPDGVLTGSLYLRGSGDPSLSPRYFRDELPMDALARQVAQAGIKRVHGDLVADASIFEDKPVPDGWQTRYLGASYAARVSALSLNENLVWVSVQADGKTAKVTLEPETTALPVESTVRVVGGSGGRITASRRSDGVIQVRGTIGASSMPRKYSLVVDDPSLFTAGALRASLQKMGVTVDGALRAGTTPAGATTVTRIESPALSRIVTSMNRESINVFAELLLRATAHAIDSTSPGSAATGQAALQRFLGEKVGAPPQALQISDGSGLSVNDHLTPRAMIDLLAYAHRAPWGPVFHASLPVAGESETLRGRMRASPAQGNLHAKTGTTNTVSSLGGYVTARDGEIIAFSFIYNGNDRWNARVTQDQMGSTLAQFVRD